MSTTTLKLILEPVGSYFFGGEKSFGAQLAGIRADDANGESPIADGFAFGAQLAGIRADDQTAKNYFRSRASYFVRSERLPQQTHLLGMLRKTLLHNRRLMYYFKNFTGVPKGLHTQAVKLAGRGKWQPNAANMDFGIIRELSPVFLECDGQVLYPAPVDRGWRLVQTGTGTDCINNKSTACINGRPRPATRLIHKDNPERVFGAKDHLTDGWMDTAGIFLPSDDLFVPHIRTHTQTLPYKEDDEEQLFKVQRYKFKKERKCRFVLNVTLDDTKISTPDLLEALSGIVELGGEDSHFRLSAESNPINIPDCMDAWATDRLRIMLLSDTCVPAEIFDACDLVLAHKNALRTVQRTESRDFDGKSARLVTLSRGSILYPSEDKAQAVANQIEENVSCRNIGYNHYRIITPKTTSTQGAKA